MVPGSNPGAGAIFFASYRGTSRALLSSLFRSSTVVHSLIRSLAKHDLRSRYFAKLSGCRVWICGNGKISAFFVSTKKRERTETNGEIAPVTHRYPPFSTVSYRYFFRCWTLTCAMCSENPPSSTNLSNFLQISFSAKTKLH